MLRLRPLPATLTGHEPFYLIATWFQTGRIRPASGSWGSLFAWPFCWLMVLVGGIPALAAFALAALGAGMWSIKTYAKHTHHTDPSEIVIDEVVGMALMWLFIPPSSFLWGLIGFVIFRVLDSLKPGPVGWCDRNLKGAAGVIMDDVVAGLLSGLIIYGLLLLFPYTAPL